MLVSAALVLLAVWVGGILGLFDIGRAIHVFFLVGLMLLMLGVLKGRDEAERRRTAADRDSA